MRGRRLVGGLLALALVVGCSGGGDDDEGDRPSRRIEERPVPVDYSQAQLADVPGTTTSTAVPEVGTASIVGSVTGPSGPVAGATVRIERLVPGGEVVARDVQSGPDGRYGAPGIPGGRYRVRAFVPPALAMTDAEVRFLPDGKEAVFDLVLTDQRRLVARSAVSPRLPYVGDAINLAVVIATYAVDGDGIVRSSPLPGTRVELDGLGAWSLRQDRPLRPPASPRSSTTTSTTAFVPRSAVAFTDGSGVVRYELECEVGGRPGLGVLVAVTVTPQAVEGQPPPVSEQRVQRIALDLPECVDPATATTATTAPSASTTSTTRATTADEDD